MVSATTFTGAAAPSAPREQAAPSAPREQVRLLQCRLRFKGVGVAASDCATARGRELLVVAESRIRVEIGTWEGWCRQEAPEPNLHLDVLPLANDCVMAAVETGCVGELTVSDIVTYCQSRWLRKFERRCGGV